MYAFLYRKLVLAQVSPNSYRSFLGSFSSLSFLPNESLLSISIIRPFSTESEQKDHSFRVSYLINSCGLSPESAKSVSEKVKFRSPEQPDSVLQTLRDHGFTTSHIAKLVRMRPTVLLARPKRTLLPKLQFFNSIGITDAELADVCSSIPAILGQSLENILIPNYNFLKNLLHSDEMVVKAFRKKSWIFLKNLQKNASPKLAVFRELGLPESFVPLILTCYVPIVLQSQDKFDKNVKKAIEMGFDPQKFGFIHAMQVFVSITESTWERKLDLFKRWGWSDSDVGLAFKRCPNVMNASEDKIKNGMEFLVNKMGWQSTDVALYPDVFLMNLERRVIPRCLVIDVLKSKGLIRKELGLSPFLRSVESAFLKRFVTKYTADVPQLLNIYHRKEGFQAVEIREL
ncbi:hypothetical protein Dsin_025332 [Dipteronia sinensis]|uniref:Uncharacterized protein n=1 Tax=Dipteronia sinensis TaxID=43782 RepID=A0AAD9ZW40_9ROSI|nr:hypothetical protein Dsin_025332 [Dipteronia sinensis]